MSRASSFLMPFKAKILFFLFLIFLSAACQPRIANVHSTGETIVCFGDSLTQGVGASQEHDYPSLLAQMLQMPTINAGVGGNTTRDALERLDRDVLQKNPRLVIVEFCGNDFLQKIPVAETIQNLDEIVRRIQEAKAMVVLVHLRAGFFVDEYLKGFERIARKRQTLLIKNILKGILGTPRLKSDQLHPNDDGYAIMAQRIYKVVLPLVKR